MASSDLELYYERKMRLVLDALDELDRLELDPKTTADERNRIREIRPSLDREFALVDTQYAGVIAGQSTLPLPPEALRRRISELCDQVEKQININKAAVATVGAATTFVDLLSKIVGQVQSAP